MVRLDEVATIEFRGGGWTAGFVVMLGAVWRDGRGLSCVLYMMLFTVA